MFNPDGIPAVGKSTLLGFNYRLVGFAFASHPLDKKKKVQLTFFQQLKSLDGLFAICCSDVINGVVDRHTQMLTDSLGNAVGAEEVIPYVHRSINDATYDQFKNVINTGLDKTSVVWWK